MTRRIPPFAALRAYEATARHGTLRRAGEELALSVSAISHQIKSLENFLGVALFYREKNTLILTPAGRDYLVDLTRSLDQLANATARVEQLRHLPYLTVNLFPSLAALWLLPRLSAYRLVEPNVDVRVMTTAEPVDFRTGTIDIAIRYAFLATEGFRADVLFEEEAFPVCSPAYAKQFREIRNEGNFSACTIIHCQAAPSEWEDWFAFTKSAGKRSRRNIVLDSRLLALEAAADGLGVAMGRTPVVDRALASGRLLPLSDRRLVTGETYTVVVPERSLRMPAVRSFRTWLMSEACQPPTLRRG